MNVSNEYGQQNIILIVTGIDAVQREVNVSADAQNRMQQVKPGETYRLVQRVNDQLIPLENVIVLRSGQDLVLRFGQGQSMVFAGYYQVCAEDECQLLLAIDSVAADEYFSLPADSLGLELGDGSHLMFAAGDTETLLQMATAEPLLTQALQAAAEAKPVVGELIAEAQEGIVLAQAEGFNMVSGLALLAGATSSLAVMTGGNGSSYSIPGTNVSTAQAEALDKIKAYTQGDETVLLTLEDYLAAGFVGVTVENLAAVNAHVAAAAIGEAGTVEQVQALVDKAIALINNSVGVIGNIIGQVTEDETLSAGDISDLNGITGGLSKSVSYQWQVADSTTAAFVDIPGATGKDLTLTQQHVGKFLKVVASYTDAKGVDEQISSPPSAKVTNVNDQPTGLISLKRSFPNIDIFYADTTAIADEDGLGEFKYQWQVADSKDGDYSPIAGETAKDFMLSEMIIDKHVRVIVSYEDQWGRAETMTSEGEKLADIPFTPEPKINNNGSISAISGQTKE